MLHSFHLLLPFLPLVIAAGFSLYHLLIEVCHCPGMCPMVPNKPNTLAAFPHALVVGFHCDGFWGFGNFLTLFFLSGLNVCNGMEILKKNPNKMFTSLDYCTVLYLLVCNMADIWLIWSECREILSYKHIWGWVLYWFIFFFKDLAQECNMLILCHKVKSY